MKNVSDKIIENTETNIFSSVSVFENRAVYEIMWKKQCKAEQATDDNMAHAHCRLDT
jgi:hypothetical protein